MEGVNVNEVKVTALAGGADSEDFVAMLTAMYAAWGGPVGGEGGIHMLVRVSPHDEQHRRVSCFASVSVDGAFSDRWVRKYVLDPYELAKNYDDGRERADVLVVLAGDLKGLTRLTDEDCQMCGGENPCWFADSELWNAATAHGAPYGKNSILCPQCFVRLFVANTGNDPAWQLVPDPVSRGGLMSDVWTPERKE